MIFSLAVSDVVSVSTPCHRSMKEQLQSVLTEKRISEKLSFQLVFETKYFYTISDTIIIHNK